MESVAKRLNNVPVAVGGLALGIAGLGGALGLVFNPTFKYTAATIAGVLLLVILFKQLLNFKTLVSDISHPVTGSYIPTFAMGVMVISDSLVSYNVDLGRTLWYGAIALHIIYATSFFYYRFKDFDLNHMLPSWFVPPVGIVIACVTATHMGANDLAHDIFYVGLILYAVLLPVMFYRLMFGEKIQEAQLPSFGIIGAPASVLLAGYITSFGNLDSCTAVHPDATILGGLLTLSLLMTSIVYISMTRINHYRIAFNPLYASFTFPLAIGATAVIKYGMLTKSSVWTVVGEIELIIASVVIVWVFIKMLNHVVTTQRVLK